MIILIKILTIEGMIYVVLTFDFMLPNTNFYSTTIFDIFRFIHKPLVNSSKISINFEAAENTFFS